MVSAPARREQVAFAMARGASQRRACYLLSVVRSTLGYERRLAVKDAPVKVAMHRLAARGRTGVTTGPGLSHLEPGGPAGAPQAQASPGVLQPATPAGANDDERCLVVRFHVRRLCQRPATEVPDGGGRVHPRAPCDRCGRKHPVRPRDRDLARALQRGQAAFQPGLPDPESVQGWAINHYATEGHSPAIDGPKNAGRSLSSMRDVSVVTRHFETVALEVLGDTRPRRLLSESKHSRRLTLFDSAAHRAISVLVSALAESGAKDDRTERATTRNLRHESIGAPNRARAGGNRAERRAGSNEGWAACGVDQNAEFLGVVPISSKAESFQVAQTRRCLTAQRSDSAAWQHDSCGALLGVADT